MEWGGAEALQILDASRPRGEVVARSSRGFCQRRDSEEAEVGWLRQDKPSAAAGAVASDPAPAVRTAASPSPAEAKLVK